MSGPDLERAQREDTRWLILQVLDKARPLGAPEELILVVVQARYAAANQSGLRREMDYLEKRELIKIVRAPSGPWTAELLRYGIEIVDYTVDCDPGIARPPKYW